MKKLARDKVKVCAHARIVGIVFWDRPHTSPAGAPNTIELHPILDFGLSDDDDRLVRPRQFCAPRRI
jgi:hypothetical protein